jgi:hypothetical protein
MNSVIERPIGAGKSSYDLIDPALFFDTLLK